jgi:hypothetical protein
MIIQSIGILENCLINSPKSYETVCKNSHHHSAAGKESNFSFQVKRSKERIFRLIALGLTRKR